MHGYKCYKTDKTMDIARLWFYKNMKQADDNTRKNK